MPKPGFGNTTRQQFAISNYTRPVFRASYFLHMRVSGLGKCANPECEAEFKRLGDGKLYTLSVSHSQAWGLPPHVKQKVVWLCSRCALTREVEFDKQHCQVLLVRRHRPQKQTA